MRAGRCEEKRREGRLVDGGWWMDGWYLHLILHFRIIINQKSLTGGRVW